MTNLAPGTLVSYFVAAMLLALPASLIVLFAYRRAVGRGMSQRAGVETVTLRGLISPRSADPPVSAGRSATGDPARVRMRLWVVYGTAAVMAAIVQTIFYFSIEGADWSPFRGFVLVYQFGWPLAPTMAVLLERPLFATLRFTLGYAAIGALVVLIWSMVSRFALGHAYSVPLQNLRGYFAILVTTAAIPFAMVLISGVRRLRPVVPLVLAGVLLFSFASLGLQVAFVRVADIGVLRESLLKIGYAPFFLIASLPGGYLCWLALHWLARRYQAKGYSDLQLLVDAWWLIAIFSASTSLEPEVGWRRLLSLVAFVVYRLTVHVGLASWRISSHRPAPSRLLLLRVFGAPRRGEGLFDAVAGRWRFEGNVNMIGGTDLAARTVDPGEILPFVGGQVRSLFVRDQTDLERRVATLDESRDPDGRFRVNDFFCFDDTWRLTLEELLARSDLVLMDLRGFSRRNAGCLYEMEKLVERDRLGRTVFVLDGASDEPLFRETVRQALGQRSPEAEPPLTIVRVTRLSALDVNKISTELRTLAA